MSVVTLPGPIDQLTQGLLAGSKLAQTAGEIQTRTLQNQLIAKQLGFIDETQQLETALSQSLLEQRNAQTEFEKLRTSQFERLAPIQTQAAEADIEQTRAQTDQARAGTALTTQRTDQDRRSTAVSSSIGNLLNDSDVTPQDISAAGWAALQMLQAQGVKEGGPEHQMINGEITREYLQMKAQLEGLEAQRNQLNASAENMQALALYRSRPQGRQLSPFTQSKVRILESEIKALNNERFQREFELSLAEQSGLERQVTDRIRQNIAGVASRINDRTIQLRDLLDQDFSQGIQGVFGGEQGSNAQDLDSLIEQFIEDNPDASDDEIRAYIESQGG